MNTQQAYLDFVERLTHLIRKNPHLIKTTLSNIFTMRLIGNKTHGDLAEIGISEFINQFMYDFKSVHVGKDLYRAKAHEEDIKVTNEIKKIDFSVSIKAYGDGPLQLSTDKNFRMFPRLEKESGEISGKEKIRKVLDDAALADFDSINVLALIYREKEHRFNILVYNYGRAKEETVRIVKENPGARRKYPIYRFFGSNSDYVCEVRFGGVSANALQRGLWTHTKRGVKYFDSVTGGWIDYSDNLLLVKLFSHALVSTQTGHEGALKLLVEDIEKQKRMSSLK